MVEGDDAPVEIEDELANVATWRITCLTAAGFDADFAGRLAADPDVDLHRAVEMKQHGCPQKLVEAILT